MSTERKIIACMNVGWNVDWILPRNLAVLANIVDEIVVVGGNLSKNAVNLINGNEKVTFFLDRKNEKWRSEVKDFNIMTREAGRRGADWVIFVDFDEVFSAQAAEKIRKLAEADGVGVYRFPRVWLWRGEEYYRVDRPEKYVRHNQISVMVRYSSELQWPGLSGPFWKRVLKHLLGREKLYPQHGRGEIQGYKGRVVDTDVVLLHYAAVNWEHFVRKSMRYVGWERIRLPKKPLDDIVGWAYETMDEKGLALKEAHPDWFNYPFKVPDVEGIVNQYNVLPPLKPKAEINIHLS